MDEDSPGQLMIGTAGGTDGRNAKTYKVSPPLNLGAGNGTGRRG